MFILYFALWVILNGRWTPEIGAFGVVFAALAYVFSCRYLGYGLGVDLALIRRAPAAIRYGVSLLCEIIKANFAVIRMIMDPDFEPQPQLIRFDAKLMRGRHLVTLANSITLTPGTITVDLDGSRYLVHCLDASMVEGLDDGALVSALEEMEKKHSPLPAAQPAQEETVNEEAVNEETAEEAAVTEETVTEAAETAETEAAPSGGEGGSAEEGATDDEH